MDDERDLTPAEAEALRLLGERWTPPDDLAEETVKSLRARALLAARTRRPWAVIPAAAAAAVAAFVIGFALGAARSGPSPTVPPTTSTTEAKVSETDKYVLLLFENEDYRTAPNGEVLKGRIREYGDWMRATGKSGRYVSGEKLADDGRWCRMRGDHVEVLDPVSDGSRGALAGYFIIGAGSYDEAVGIARGCPHLHYGGTIEVRRLES